MEQKKQDLVDASSVKEGVRVNKGAGMKGEAKLMKKLPKASAKNNIGIIIGSLIVVIGGLVSGWMLSGGAYGATTKTEGVDVEKGSGDGFGKIDIDDESIDLQEAEGVLEEGGIRGEGTHHLVRSEDPSKNAYLTSTVIDLQGMVGKKVKIWGQTLSGIEAGWLMDVVKIQEIK